MTRHIAIVGAGASGSILAANIDRISAGRTRVSLIEGGERAARGIAYSSFDPAHLLNTRVRNMSAFSDEPRHFADWLQLRGAEGDAESFVSRQVYGDYLEEQIAPGLARGNISLLYTECLAVVPRTGGVVLHLKDGSSIIAHAAVLATGHLADTSASSVLSNAWEMPRDPDPEATVLFVGSGLTMVDWALSLLERGHRGKLIALSRSGLLPAAHTAAHPMLLSSADIPLGTSLHFLMRWLRDLVKQRVAQGGDWREVVDGIRPHVQTIWRHLPDDGRETFLRRLATVWDVHRHRMPPRSAERIHAAMAEGRLVRLRGHFLDARQTGEGIEVDYRPAGDAPGVSRTLRAGFGVDCRGIRRCPRRNATPVMRSLLDTGSARIDKLGLGLEFDAASRLTDAAGRPQSHVFGIGPVTRAAFWEITAIPDIREQARQLAAILVAP